MGKLKVTVNPNKCVGSRLCIQFLPEVFVLNEEGQSKVVKTEDVDVKVILSTAEQCPQCAIRVKDMDTDEVLFPPPGMEF